MKQQYKEQLFVMECNAKEADEIETAIAAFVAKYKKINIAIHNACKCTLASMEDTPEDIYKEVFDVNYFGALRLTKSVASYMKDTGGKVIFTSSGVGLVRHIGKKSFIICHSLSQKIQTMICYLFPIKMGKLMSKMTEAYEE